MAVRIPSNKNLEDGISRLKDGEQAVYNSTKLDAIRVTRSGDTYQFENGGTGGQWALWGQPMKLDMAVQTAAWAIPSSDYDPTAAIGHSFPAMPDGYTPADRQRLGLMAPSGKGDGFVQMSSATSVQELEMLTQGYMEKHKVSYSDAFKAIGKAHPDLAAAVRTFSQHQNGGN